MPNYSYVVDASYSPFTLQEMLYPFAAYKEVTDKDIETSVQLAKDANVFEYLSKTLPEDSKARQIYERYANDLKAQSDDFSLHGRTMMNSNDLLNLRRRYSGEIGRLERADKVLQEEMNRRLSEKDTSMIYGNNNLTIDDFLDNNIPNLYKISGNELMALGEAMGKQISSRRYKQDESGTIMGGQYNLFKETQGISPEELDSFMRTEGDKLADQILYERGATDNLSGYEYRRAKQSVLNGIYAGIVYNESTKPIANGEYVNKKDRMDLALKARSLAISEAKEMREANAAGLSSGIKITPKNLYSPKEKATIKDDGTVYDATKRTEFEYKLKKDMQPVAKQNILLAANGQPLREVELDDKTNKFKPTGKELKLSEFYKDDYVVLADYFGPYGSTAMIVDKEGNVKRYMLPQSIDRDSEYNRDSALEKALQWQNIAIEKATALRSRGIDLNNADQVNAIDNQQDYDDYQTYAYAMKKYKESLEDATLYHSQLYVTNTTDEQQFKPYGN